MAETEISWTCVRRGGSRLAAFLVLTGAAAFLLGSPAFAAHRVQHKAVPPPPEKPALSVASASSTASHSAPAAGPHLPRVLSAVDAERYREIFELQDRGRFTQADRLIRSLSNKILMGDVLAQRYLHPSYRSKYSELASWLGSYSDLPDAPRIYKLALKKGGHHHHPKAPTYSTSYQAENAETVALASAARAAQRPWDEGLAKFRAGHYRDAAQDFERVALIPGLSSWTASGGAFWAARSYLLAGEPEKVNHWLGVAAKEPRTFYGLLALHNLGLKPPLVWKLPSAGSKGFDEVLHDPAGKRAIALIEAQANDQAERELLGMRGDASKDELLALVAIAQDAHLPALSIKIGRQLLGDGVAADAALYPIPGWQPEGGYKVDRAMVYALMRQESAFNPDATSPAGARGLMQIMPATAAFITHDKRLASRDRDRLYDPTFNVTLGQRYILRLLADHGIQNDMIVMTAAYNFGPGNVAKWQQRVDYKDDPLLYMATIPSRETRQFVERVFANLWIYRMRLGQPAAELIALGEGKWPLYAALDSQDTSVAFVDDDGTISSGDYGRAPHGGN